MRSHMEDAHMFSKSKTLALIAFVIAVSILQIQPPASADKIPSTTWMGMYFGRTKIGYAEFNIDKSAYNGVKGYRLDSTMNTRMLVLGIDVVQIVDTTVYLDSNYTPIFQLFKMSSAGHTTIVNATYTPEKIIAELDAGGAKTTKIIPIPPGSKIVSDTIFPTADEKLNVGDKLDSKTFNPLTLTLDDVHSVVLRRESIQLDGNTVNSFVVRSATSMGDITCWQDNDGELLKAIGPMGITLLREPKTVARAINKSADKETYFPPSDLAVTAAPSVTSDITDPRDVKSLQIRFTGIADKTLAINDSRQKVTLSGDGPFTAEYEINATEFDQSKAAALPIDSTGMNSFLGESAYVQPTNPEIAALAKQITGTETNSARAVSLLRAWVNSNMQAKGDVGIVRSSLDVLHTKTGVCRDYAILYAALARATGIPTKLVSGLVFWKGKFYYHAWAESFVGQWIPVDSTISTDFVDATHIKFAEGDATTMFTVVKLMGTIKAEVLKFESR